MINWLSKFIIGKHITDYKFSRQRGRCRIVYNSFFYVSILFFVSIWIAGYDKFEGEDNSFQLVIFNMENFNVLFGSYF